MYHAFLVLAVLVPVQIHTFPLFLIRANKRRTSPGSAMKNDANVFRFAFFRPEIEILHFAHARQKFAEIYTILYEISGNVYHLYNIISYYEVKAGMMPWCVCSVKTVCLSASGVSFLTMGRYTNLSTFKLTSPLYLYYIMFDYYLARSN